MKASGKNEVQEKDGVQLVSEGRNEAQGGISQAEVQAEIVKEMNEVLRRERENILARVKENLRARAEKK